MRPGSLSRMTLIKALAAFLIAMSLHSGASACSWPKGVFKEGIRQAERVRGQLVLEYIQPSDGGSLLPVDHKGVITDNRGRKIQVSYQTAILKCSPFSLPVHNVSGMFFVEANGDGTFTLVHWKPRA